MNNPIHVGFVSVDFRSSRGDNAKETDRHSRNFERFFAIEDRGYRGQMNFEGRVCRVLELRRRTLNNAT